MERQQKLALRFGPYRPMMLMCKPKLDQYWKEKTQNCSKSHTCDDTTINAYRNLVPCKEQSPCINLCDNHNTTFKKDLVGDYTKGVEGMFLHIHL